jgi:hypothetical protein
MPGSEQILTTVREWIDDVPLSEARQAVALARQVRKHVRTLLPKEALRRRKR